MAFLITLPLVLLVGGILLGPLESDVLVPPEVAIVVLISILVGLILAVFVEIKYYHYLEKTT